MRCSRPWRCGSTAHSRADVGPDEPELRLATPADEAAIERLMKDRPRSSSRASTTSARQRARSLRRRGRSVAASRRHLLRARDRRRDGCLRRLEPARPHVHGKRRRGGRRAPLDPATEPARVRAMFVRADWMRRGLGRRILEACEAAAREEGFGELTSWQRCPGCRCTSPSGSSRSTSSRSRCRTASGSTASRWRGPSRRSDGGAATGFGSRREGHHPCMSTYTKTNLKRRGEPGAEVRHAVRARGSLRPHPRSAARPSA